MEHKVRVLPPEALAEQLPELLAATAAVPLVITGNSMSPFLVHLRDTVYLSAISTAPKRGDIVFYRRDSGAYVLHRICKAGDDTFRLVGDAQTRVEDGIRREQLLAVASAVCRKGKLLKKGSFWWDFFETVWLWLLPVRPLLIRAYSLLRGRRKGEKNDD